MVALTLRRPEPRKVAKPKLVAQTHGGRGEAPRHHFFASSAGTWRVGYDVAQLVADMRKEGMRFNLWLVPGSKDADYEISFFSPQVEGATFLAYYGPEGAE